MAKLYNIARMTTATTGTGTITLGSAVSGYLTFALAGVSDGETIAYGIKDGTNSEVGIGTYTSSGTTLTRSVTKSTNSDSAINLSGTAEVYITARKEDFLNAADPLTSSQVAVQSDQETATSTTLAVTPGRQQYHPSALKAWVKFDGTGTPAITVSYNCSSITDNATGDWTVNWTTAFSSANWHATLLAGTPAAGTSLVGVGERNSGGGSASAATASAIRVNAYSLFASPGTATDTVRMYVSGAGDQ